MIGVHAVAAIGNYKLKLADAEDTDAGVHRGRSARKYTRVISLCAVPPDLEHYGTAYNLIVNADDSGEYRAGAREVVTDI
jgi:hypothetical protein